MNYLQRQQNRQDDKELEYDSRFRITGKNSYCYDEDITISDLENDIKRLQYALEHAVTKKQKSKINKKLDFYKEDYSMYLI